MWENNNWGLVIRHAGQCVRTTTTYTENFDCMKLKICLSLKPQRLGWNKHKTFLRHTEKLITQACLLALENNQVIHNQQQNLDCMEFKTCPSLSPESKAQMCTHLGSTDHRLAHLHTLQLSTHLIPIEKAVATVWHNNKLVKTPLSIVWHSLFYQWVLCCCNSFCM